MSTKFRFVVSCYRSGPQRLVSRSLREQTFTHTWLQGTLRKELELYCTIYMACLVGPSLQISQTGKKGQNNFFLSQNSKGASHTWQTPHSTQVISFVTQVLVQNLRDLKSHLSENMQGQILLCLCIICHLRVLHLPTSSVCVSINHHLFRTVTHQ